MPIFSGEASRLVHVDANAVIDYVREFTLHKLGMRGTGHRAEVLRVRLGQIGPVLVAETAGVEAERNLKKDLEQKLGRGNLRYVSRPAVKFLRKYLTAARVKDNIDRVHAAREMYALISGDPHNEKFSHWKKKKGRIYRQTRTRVRCERPDNTINCGPLCTKTLCGTLDARHGLYHV